MKDENGNSLWVGPALALSLGRAILHQDATEVKQ